MTYLSSASLKKNLDTLRVVSVSKAWPKAMKFVLVPTERGMRFVRVPELSELIGSAKGADTSNYRDRNDRY